MLTFASVGGVKVCADHCRWGGGGGGGGCTWRGGGGGGGGGVRGGWGWLGGGGGVGGKMPGKIPFIPPHCGGLLEDSLEQSD